MGRWSFWNQSTRGFDIFFIDIDSKKINQTKMTWFILGFPVHIISVYSDPVIIHSLDKKYQLKSIPVQSFICYIWRKGVNQEYKQNCFLGLDVRIWCSISGTFPDGNWWNTTTGDSIETMQTVFWIPIPILGSKKSTVDISLVELSKESKKGRTKYPSTPLVADRENAVTTKGVCQ